MYEIIITIIGSEGGKFFHELLMIRDELRRFHRKSQSIMDMVKFGDEILMNPLL